MSRAARANGANGAARATGAVAVLLLPGFVFSFLLALAERDWFHCFTYAETASGAPPLPSIFSAGELTPVLVQTLTAPVSTALMALLHAAPTAVFALFVFRTRSRPARRAQLAGLALLLGYGAWYLTPPVVPHGCDGSGPPEATALLSHLALVGTALSLIINKLTCIAGACRP